MQISKVIKSLFTENILIGDVTHDTDTDCASPIFCFFSIGGDFCNKLFGDYPVWDHSFGADFNWIIVDWHKIIQSMNWIGNIENINCTYRNI